MTWAEKLLATCLTLIAGTGVLVIAGADPFGADVTVWWLCVISGVMTITHFYLQAARNGDTDEHDHA